MYERFYHLRERPFALSPDPEYLYPSRIHREALDYLRFGLEGQAGFVLITGEIGSGKTTLLQVLLRNLDSQTTVVRLANTLLDARELVEALLLGLGVENPPATKPAMLRDLARLLVDLRSRGQRVIAVIDEAQNLSLEALEELRMLSNLETEKSKLMQIVLVGQPQLRTTLGLPALEQLRQRVTVRYHIDPLDAAETANYINHRLQRAALGAPLQMSKEVTDAVHARSGGVPRLINVICDGALLFGYAEEARQIDLALLEEVFQELAACDILRPAGWKPSLSADDQIRAHDRDKVLEPAEDRVRLLSDEVVRTEHTSARAATVTEPAAEAPVLPARTIIPAMPARQAAAPAGTASATMASASPASPSPAPAPAASAPAHSTPRASMPTASSMFASATAAKTPIAQAPMRSAGQPQGRQISPRDIRTGPAAPAPAQPQRSSAWDWMKEVIFGRPSEVGGG